MKTSLTIAVGALVSLGEARHLMGKMGKMGQGMMKAKKAKKACQVEFKAEQVENLCTLWEVFDNMGRAENDNPAIPGFEWPDLCDDFEPMNAWLCPSSDVVQEGICSHRRPWLNPAIREHYCGPLMEALPPGSRSEACETWCTNYVSQDRGDCCDIQCPP